MITEKDLTEAIAYCDGKVDAKPNHAVLMAACYYLKDRLYPSKDDRLKEPTAPAYSYATEPKNHAEPTIDYYSDTEFSEAVDGRAVSEVMPIIDELMSVLQATNPRLYAGVMRKIEQ